MTNTKIIFDAAIASGIFTAEQAEAILSTGRRLPLHTFAEWKKLGYIVKKGEKSRLSVDIWMKSNRKKKDENEQETAVEENRFYKKLSHFFTFDQVQKMEA